MTRWFGPTRRRLGALVALVVLPSLAPDLFGLSCPHHAGHGEAGSTHAEAPVESGTTHSDPAPHPASHAPGGSSTSPGHPGTGGAPPCTCAGSCPVSGSPTVAAAPNPGTQPRARLTASAAPATDAGPRPTPRFVLPFANGPPAA